MRRLFVGMALPEEVKASLARLGKETGLIESVRWIPARNLHLTLKFLGEVRDEMVPELTALLTDGVRDFGEFTFALDAAGAFPSPKRARVIWYGVGEGSEQIKRVAGAVEAVANSLGFPSEGRPFHPHVTCARVKTPADVSEAIGAMGSVLSGTRVRVDRVTLFESRLERSGAEYEALEEFPL